MSRAVGCSVKCGSGLLLAAACTVFLLRALPRSLPRAPTRALDEPPMPPAVEKSASGCALCMGMRCHAVHQCGRFFAEPTGWERPYCACACCRIQCGGARICKGVPPHPPGFPINVSTLAGSGDGPGPSADAADSLSARFGGLAALAISPAQHALLVADETNSAVRIVEPLPTAASAAVAGARVRTLRSAVGERPRGLAPIGTPASSVLVADTLANVLRVVDLDSGNVSLVIGSGEWDQIDGAAADAAFSSPNGVAVAADGSFAVVADTENNAIRLVELPAGAVRTLAGAYTELPPEEPVDGAAAAARFSQPMDVALSADGRTAYVADTGFHLIRAVDVASGATRTLAGSGERGAHDSGGHRHRLGDFYSPRALCLAPGGRALLVADSGNNLIRRVELSACGADERCAVRTLAGQGVAGDRDGIAPAATFSSPVGIDAAPLDAPDSGAGGELPAAQLAQVFVTDAGSARIRRIVYDVAAVFCAANPDAEECES